MIVWRHIKNTPLAPTTTLLRHSSYDIVMCDTDVAVKRLKKSSKIRSIF